MKAIADTGFLVAFGNRHDVHQDWAVELAKRLREPLISCAAVLAESAFHLGSTEFVLSLVKDEMLRLAFDLHRNLDQLEDLAVRYRDRKPELADLCLIRMSELFPKHAILTVDVADFRIDRRDKREAIPIISPPGL